MTRSIVYVVASLALATSLPGYESRAVAQESADASAEAAADENSAGGEASADANADAQQSDTDSQSSTSSEAENRSETQTSTSGETSNSQSPADDTATQDNSSSDASSTPAQPSRERDAQTSTDTDVNADADASRTRTRSDAHSNQRNRSGNRDFDDNDRGDADTSVQRRANRDDRNSRDHRDDARRGIRFGRATDRGLTIHDIERNSFYVDSGLRRGDIIISLHGRSIRSEADFHRHVVRYHGERVPLIVLRDGRRETIYVEYPQEAVYSERVYDNRPMHGHAYLGVVFDAKVRDAAVVHSVAPASPAEEAGLQRGDTILALNGQEVMTYQDAIGIVRLMRPGDRLDIVIGRGRSEAETEAVLAAQPATTVRAARVEERGVFVQPPQGDVEVEVEGRAVERGDDRRLLDRDRDDDGNRDRGLIQRVLE